MTGGQRAKLRGRMVRVTLLLWRSSRIKTRQGGARLGWAGQEHGKGKGANGTWWRFRELRRGLARRGEARQGTSKARVPTALVALREFWLGRAGHDPARPGWARLERGEGTNGAFHFLNVQCERRTHDGA